MMMSRGEYVRIISIWTWLTRDLKVVEVGRYHKNVQNVFDILSLYQIKRFLSYALKDEYRMISIIREKNVKKCSSLMFCILIAWLEHGNMAMTRLSYSNVSLNFDSQAFDLQRASKKFSWSGNWFYLFVIRHITRKNLSYLFP